MILDADKEGFLRAERSLIQTCGRAARNEHGKVIMYGDRITRSMQVCLDETARRRKIQHEHNLKHGITPQTVKRKVNDLRALVHDEVLSAEQELAAGGELDRVMAAKKIAKGGPTKRPGCPLVAKSRRPAKTRPRSTWRISLRCLAVEGADEGSGRRFELRAGRFAAWIGFAS